MGPIYGVQLLACRAISVCIWKILGPFATASLRAAARPFTRCRYWRTPAIAQAVCDVHDNNDDNDNAWQKGPLWPHRMGPIMQCHLGYNHCVAINKWWVRSVVRRPRPTLATMDCASRTVSTARRRVLQSRCPTARWTRVAPSTCSTAARSTHAPVHLAVAPVSTLIGRALRQRRIGGASSRRPAYSWNVLHLLFTSCEVLWWACLSVRWHISETRWPIELPVSVLVGCCLWPWLGPPLTAFWYVIYFRFSGWRHVHTVGCVMRHMYSWAATA